MEKKLIQRKKTKKIKMESKNWLQKKARSIEDNIKSLDSDFSSLPPYKKGKEAGGFISACIDSLVDVIFPSK